MPKAYFITGTDTGVGKTFVAAAAAGALRTKGHRVGVMKPVETGCGVKDGVLVPPDALLLKDAAGSEAPLDTINPYRFPEPLAPSVAAKIAGVKIDFDKIKNCFMELGKGADIMLVEGAGGLLVPLDDERTYADLVNLLGIDLVLVAASKLGVINHTLLTVRCAKALGIGTRAIILNHPTPTTDESARVNREVIEKISGVPIINELPYCETGEPAKKVAESIDLEGIFAA
jgi:dethiobiotin synthetase